MFMANTSFAKSLKLKNRRLYRVFGSGSFHAPHQFFQSEVKLVNGGRNINLVRSCGTRMASVFLSLARSLRLMKPLRSTVNSAKWESHDRTAIMNRAAADINNDKFWKQVYVVLRALWPILKCLRLCDSNKPGMCKVVYLMQKTREALEKSKADLDDLTLFTVNTDVAIDEEDAEFSDDEDDEEEASSDEEEEGEDEGGEDADKDADEDEEVSDFDTLSEKMIKIFNKRAAAIENPFATLAWICSVDPEVRKDVKARFKKVEHQDDIEKTITITKLYAHETDANIPEILNTFWKEWRHFSDEMGMYEQRNRWNVRDALEGNSAEWHSHYSLGGITKVLGFVACRVCSKLVGMGPSERAWAGTKEIASGQRSHISAGKLEKATLISTTYRLDRAQKQRVALEKIDCREKGALFGEEDERFDLGLEKFGVDVDALKDTPTAPLRKFRCWLEEWEKPLLKQNDAVAKMKLLQKYGGLVIRDIDNNDLILTISRDKMQYEKGRKGGWAVLAEPPEYDGSNDDILEPLTINEECLIFMIAKTDQPKKLNVEKVYPKGWEGEKEAE